jgi:hypothetical protein
MDAVFGRASVILGLATWFLLVGGASAQPPVGLPRNSATMGLPVNMEQSLGPPAVEYLPAIENVALPPQASVGLPPQPNVSPLDIELGLVPPSPDTLFRTESESEYVERLRKEALQQNIKLIFPGDGKPLQPPVVAIPRPLPPQEAVCPSAPVCHHPLYFDDPMTERYGWYVPYLQPAISAGKFWVDTLILPCKMVAQEPWGWQCDGHKPAPGDPVPFSWPWCR